jgi:hypothetical protein
MESSTAIILYQIQESEYRKRAIKVRDNYYKNIRGKEFIVLRDTQDLCNLTLEVRKELYNTEKYPENRYRFLGTKTY